MDRSEQLEPAREPNQETSLLPSGVAARVLSLLQPPAEIAIDLESVDVLRRSELEALLHRVHRRHQTSNLLSRLPFGARHDDLLLGPARGLPSTGATLLAFHAGAGIDIGTLAKALGVTTSQAGSELYLARHALTGLDADACVHMQSLIGRCAELALDQDDAAALINHANACQQCNLILNEFQLLDDRIRDAVNEAPVTPPASEQDRNHLQRRPFLLLAPIAVAVALAVAALVSIGFGAATQPTSTPLFAAGDPGEHRGWLIVSSDQEVLAFDLESNERRRILAHPAHDWWNPWIVSPGGELVIRWEEDTRIEQRIGAIRAYDMHGDRQYLHRWAGVRSRTFSGWLDDQTVLFAERGPIARVGVVSETPDSAHPALIAANLETGDEWTVYQGPADKAVPAPDGRHLAIVRPAPAPWPGKTVDLLPVNDGIAGAPVASLAHRHLSWTGRLAWSADSQHAYFSVIHQNDVPEPLPQAGDASPGTFDLEHLHIGRIGVDGSTAEFDTSEEAAGWVVPQVVSPDNSAIAVVHNQSRDRDAEWIHGTLDIETGEIVLSGQAIPDARWWNSEALWSPDGAQQLAQKHTSRWFRSEAGNGETGSLLLGSPEFNEETIPDMVFQDTTALNLRSGAGLALLRWVSDEVMQAREEEPAERPVASAPVALSQASSNHQLMAHSSVAATGRYVLVGQHDSDSGNRESLIHLQAWVGTSSEHPGAREFAWLPREPAALGAALPDLDAGDGSRLTFLSTDLSSPLHDMTIDPAGIGNRTDLAYRTPAASPDGAHLAFFVQHRQSSRIQLWVDPWNRQPAPVMEWAADPDATIEPSLNLSWISDRAFLVTRANDWNDGYPTEISLVRGAVLDDGSIEMDELRTFRARGRDRGIDLIDIAISPNEQRIAFRLRHFTGSDPERDSSDSLLVSPTQDLAQQIEIIRGNPGGGMIWLDGGEWLVAGINERVALIEATGREVDYVSDQPAAFPVLVTLGEVWYQGLAGDGAIMRVTFD